MSTLMTGLGPTVVGVPVVEVVLSWVLLGGAVVCGGAGGVGRMLSMAHVGFDDETVITVTMYPAGGGTFFSMVAASEAVAGRLLVACDTGAVVGSAMLVGAAATVVVVAGLVLVELTGVGRLDTGVATVGAVVADVTTCGATVEPATFCDGGPGENATSAASRSSPDATTANPMPERIVLDRRWLPGAAAAGRPSHAGPVESRRAIATGPDRCGGSFSEARGDRRSSLAATSPTPTGQPPCT
jgi:hypothetical protein